MRPLMHSAKTVALFCFFIGLSVSVSSSHLSSAELTGNGVGERAPGQGVTRNAFAIATYVGNRDQQRHAATLIKSIRAFGGPYSGCTVYVVLADPVNFPCHDLKTESVILLPANVDSATLNYPLAIKAFAAAQVERLLGKSNGTLAWFDPETIVLGPLDDLDLKGNESAALRPVFLVNDIGLSPGDGANEYWAPIFSALGLDPNRIPIVETVVDGKMIKAYHNCGIFSVRPKLGILQEWARQLSPLVADTGYQRNACPTFLRRLFLHQAVFSAVIVAKTKPDELRPLPMRCGYPLNHHEQLPATKKAERLNALSCAVIDELWRQNPLWMNIIPIDEPLKSWLKQAYLDFLRIGENIYRIEGSCNSYLAIITGTLRTKPARHPEYLARLRRTYCERETPGQLRRRNEMRF